MTRLGVVAALPREAACLRWKSDPRHRRAREGPWIEVSGMGAANASGAADKLLAGGVERLMSWGVAAGLDPALPAGRLVLPEEIIGRDGEVLRVDAAWRHRVGERLRGWLLFETTPIAEADRVLGSGRAKGGLLARTGAAAADMESASIARSALRRGVPVLVLRAVADPAALSMPSAVLGSLRENGSVSPLALSQRLLRRPAELPALIDLWRAFRRATHTLERVAAQLGPSFEAAL